jgi:hypothetical protein
MKRGYVESEVRQLLREQSDGLTIAQIVDSIGIHNASVGQWLRRMPDAYIDRWLPSTRGPASAVWCVVVPPPHCPHPRELSH